MSPFEDGQDHETDAQAPAPVSADEAAEFAFVSLPDGRIVAVPKASITPVATEKQDEIASNLAAEVPEHFYVHLANGEVLRVEAADVPARGGSNAMLGHWVRNGECHTVIGVYPVETAVKG